VNIAELRQAAESGSVVAQATLGICYLYGRDVKVDYKEAFRLLSAATEKGASRAVLNLAHMYAEGFGVPKDLRQAIQFYEAVAKVEIRAQLELGRIYSRGLGVPIDTEAAQKHYSAVAAQAEVVDDLTTAALVGAVTFDELKEAKDYFASGRQ
jgi:TPR repeat protein